MTEHSDKTGLVSLDVGKQRVFCSEHHTADEDGEKYDVTVVRVIA